MSLKLNFSGPDKEAGEPVRRQYLASKSERQEARLSVVVGNPGVRMKQRNRNRENDVQIVLVCG